MRPKNSSTNLRATWVLRTRSAGAWKEPTLSARLCRRATLPALGAHGSCTCTKSSGATRRARPRSCARCRSAARARSPCGRRRTAARRRRARARRRRGRRATSGCSRAARISLRDSRTSCGLREGASSSTRWPRSASSRETSAANVPTSFASSSGCGATWAMAKRSATSGQDSQGASRARCASSAASACAGAQARGSALQVPRQAVGQRDRLDRLRACVERRVRLLERAGDRVDQGAVADACRAPRAARCRSSAR